jgi:cardiolipin synthase
LGQLLDPVADKVLLSGLFVGLAWTGEAPIWYVVIVFGRDLFLLIASIFVLKTVSYLELRPTQLGKWSTLFQIATAFVLLSSSLAGTPVVRSISTGFVWLSAALTVASGLQYALRGIHSLRRR